MALMLLAVDIGNTSTKFGIFDGESLISKFSIPTDPDSTKDDLISAIGQKLSKTISDAIVCSVVPDANVSLREFLISLGVDEPLFVENDLDFGLKINYEPLSAMGTDRIVNSFAAVEKYGVPCIVCSFGTATTFDVVDENRILLGGIIAPGMKTMAKALHLNTAKLPEVEIENPQSVIGNTTVASIQSGIFYGYLAMVEEMIQRIQNEIGYLSKVIATGGWAPVIAENTAQVDVVDDNLTLEGLSLLYRRLTSLHIR
ncbi:MAG: type III pantothenate kinase [Pyrinomonadaceae bacterium]